MLRIAVPNKGSLSDSSVDLLAEAGYRSRRRGRELVLDDPQNEAQLFFLRPRDIAVYVGQGRVHAGITGRDLVADSPAGALELMGLGFGRSKFRFAAPPQTATTIQDLQGRRVAASYDNLVRNYLAERGVQADVVHLDGAVESSVRLGVADAIADVVETGSTLRAAGLEVFGEAIMESEAVLITGERHLGKPKLKVLERRLQGVLVARDHVLIDYNIRDVDLQAAIEITPGLDSPTVSPLADPYWLAVRAVAARKTMNRTMDDLLAVGAKGIIVTELAASRIA